MPSRKAPATRGRPSKLTPALARSLAQDIDDGVPLELAAASHGLARQTVANWLYKGAEGQEPYASLTMAIAAAKKRRLARHLKHAETASETGCFNATRWLVEREYGQPDTRPVNLTGHQLPEAKALLLETETEGDPEPPSLDD